MLLLAASCFSLLTLGLTFSITIFTLAGISAFLVMFLSFFSFHLPAEALKTLRVRRIVYNRIVGKGGYILVRVMLSNQSSYRLSSVRVEDKCPRQGLSVERSSNVTLLDIKPFKTVSFDYILRAEADGAFTIGPIVLSMSDRLKLFSVSRTVMDLGKITVIPSFVDVKSSITELGLKSTLITLGEHVHEKSIVMGGGEYRSSREYVPGDDTSFIDWKATARRGKLHIKEFERRAFSRFLLVVDSGKSMSVGMKLEYVKQAVMLLSRSMSIIGDFFGLLIPSVSGVAFPTIYPRYVPLSTGMDHLYRMVTVSSQLRPSGTPDFRDAIAFIRRRLSPPLNLIFITDLEDFEKKNILEAVKEAISAGYSLICIVTPTYLFIQPGEVFESGDSQSIVLGLDYLNMLRERASSALKTLRGLGVEAYEVGPADIFPKFLKIYRYAKALTGAHE